MLLTDLVERLGAPTAALRHPATVGAPPGPVNLAAGQQDQALADTQRAISAGKTGTSLASLFTKDPAIATLGGVLGVGGSLSRIPGILQGTGSDVSKGLGVTGALTGAVSGASKIPAVASAFPDATRALNAGFSLGGTNIAGGAASIPYLDLAAGALNIGGIAASNAPDDQKAYQAGVEAAKLVAQSFVPIPGVGFVVGAMGDALGQVIFDDPYAQTRKGDAGKVRPAVTGLLGAISTATTLEELNAAATLNVASAHGEVTDGGVALRGVHLDTSAAEASLSGAYAARKAMIEAANSNPNGPEAQQLAQLKAQLDPLRDAAKVIERSLAGMLQSGDPSATAILVASLGPPAMSIDVINNDLGMLVLDQLDTWRTNLEGFRAADQGRTPDTAPHIQFQIQAARDLLNASQVLGIDLDAARARKIKRDEELARLAASQASIGSGDAGGAPGGDGGTGSGTGTGAGDAGAGGVGGTAGDAS